MTTDLIARLKECAECKLSEAWSRMDGGADLCIGAALAADAADALSDLQAENQRLRLALRIIAGYEQCLDNLMSHADIARAALNGESET